MSSKSSEDEWLRGLKESAAGIELLRSLWPKAFPQQARFVRPLVSGLAGQIAERTGWSLRYASGVLRGWKLRRAYCQAVLQYERRWDLEGEEVADAVVEDAARELASKQLARIAARRAERRAKEHQHTGKVEDARGTAERIETKIAVHTLLQRASRLPER
jgi:sRNA-binding protein